MKKVGICLLLTLLMIGAVIPATNAEEPCGYGALSGTYPITVSKTVWNGTAWTQYYEPELNEILTFKITVTYYNNSEIGYNATDIVVIDTLPEELGFVSSPTYAVSWTDGNKLYWNLTEDYGVVLGIGESKSLEFTAKVSDYGEFKNIAEVTAWETCCSWPLYGSDCVEMFLVAPPPLKFEKLVYDPVAQEWTDYLDGVLIGQHVKFKIVITYNGLEDVNVMKCMIVQDWLPKCCLVYAGNEVFTYPNASNFQDPEINVDEIGKYIVYDWTNKKFNLFAGETITIVFEAEVVEYCYGEVQNCAHVDLWGCFGCQEYVYGDDCTTVNCVPPENKFIKEVKDPFTGEWVKEAHQYIGRNVRYRITLTYYGNYNLTDVQIIDYLPFITYYVNGSATVTPSYVSNDNKTVWWNCTDDVLDGKPLVIEFEAYVWGSTGDCPGCGENLATYTAVESVTQTPYSGEDTAYISTDDKVIDLTISIPNRNIGRICARIENTGEVDVEDVSWEINVTYGLLNKNKVVNCTIDLIEINKFKDVCTGKKFGLSAIKFSFGKIYGTVTASVGYYKTTVQFSGFVLGRLILINKVGPLEE